MFRGWQLRRASAGENCRSLFSDGSWPIASNVRSKQLVGFRCHVPLSARINLCCPRFILTAEIYEPASPALRLSAPRGYSQGHSSHQSALVKAIPPALDDNGTRPSLACRACLLAQGKPVLQLVHPPNPADVTVGAPPPCAIPHPAPKHRQTTVQTVGVGCVAPAQAAQQLQDAIMALT